MEEINIQIEDTIIQVNVETPGVFKFIELEDTPQQYDEGKFLQSTANGLVFAVPQGGGDMLMSICDRNGNNIVDLTEGVRVLSAFPANPKPGDIVVVNNEIFINI